MMKNDVKLICKKNGIEVRSFQIVQTETFSKDYFSIGEGTVVEYDREYLYGQLDSELHYRLINGQSETYKIKESDEKLEFFKQLQNVEKTRFNITDLMIKECKEYGPFIITGKSRIIEIQ